MTAMPLALADSTETASLPLDIRREIGLLSRLLKEVLVSGHGGKAAACISAARQMTAAGYPTTAETIRKLSAKYKESKCDWHVLIDKRKVRHADHKLPAAFVEEVKRRFDLQPRSRKQAWQNLVREWRAGKPIVGYLHSPTADPFTDIPSGWSYKHLMRVCKSSAFERTAMTIGLGRAKAKHGPKLFTSRVGLWPMSHVMFDDVYHDTFVHLLEKRQLCRVAEFGALDVLSGSRFAYGSLPLVKRKDGTTEGLKEKQMRFLLAHVLYTYGYSPRGTSLIVERGTATIREDIIALLHDRTGGLVTVDKGGWTGKEQAVAGMFHGSGGGNPRHKSLLESFHNLAHNHFASLPGHTGPDVDRRPEFLDGLLKESDHLLKIATQLQPYQVKCLQFPTLEYFTEFVPLARDIYRAIDFDSDHDLEGWEKCGFLGRRFRLFRESKEWMDEAKFLALPASAQDAIRAIVKDDPACQDMQRLSRGEVFAMGRNETIKAPIGLIAELLFADIAEPRSSRNGYFEFEDQELDPEVLRYESRIRTLEGRENELPDGKYHTAANPFDLEQLWIYTDRGEFLGLARRVVPVSRADREGIRHELGRQQQRTADLRAPLLKRHTDITRQETLRLKHNNNVIEGPRSADEAHVLEVRQDAAPTDETDFLSDSSAESTPPLSTTTDINDEDFA